MEVSVTLGGSALLEVEDSVTLVGVPSVALKGRFGEMRRARASEGEGEG